MTFKVLGQGAPLLCLSGFGCSSWIFEDLAPALAKDFELALVENRGFGNQPLTTPYTLQDLAADALAIADRLKWDSFSILGISMGGFIAQQMALTAPLRVECLYLAGTTGRGPQFIPLPSTSEAEILAFYQLSGQEQAQRGLIQTVHPQFPIHRPDRYQQLLEARATHAPDPEAVLWQYRAVQTWLQLPALDYRQIQCPTGILHGAQDRYVSPENARFLAESIPQAHLHLIPESDHFFFYEQREAFLEALGRVRRLTCRSV
ncbi:MAG: alpha/beta hydrolase [Acidobacteria bacterium]|nr:alpha/beta hydrolase [Acidobacteriota bacterium]